MASRIEWYLVELRDRLVRTMPSERVEEVVREVEAHLRESAASFQDLDPARAEEAAVAAFGPADRVAAGYYDAHARLFGLKPGIVALGAAFVALWAWNFHWATLDGYFDNFGDTWQNVAAGAVGAAALLVLGVAVRRSLRSRRWPLLALTAGFALALVPVLSFWMIPGTAWQGVSRLHLGRDAAKLEGTIGRLDRLADYLRAGGLAYATAKSAADLPPQYADMGAASKLLGVEREYMGPEPAGAAPGTKPLPVPRDGVFAMVDGRIWALEEAKDFSEARARWLGPAPAGVGTALNDVRGERAGLVEVLSAARAAQHGRLFFYSARVVGPPVAATLVFAVALLLVDALACWLPRNWARRGRRVAA